MVTQLTPEATTAALKVIDAAFPDRPFPNDAALVQQGRWFDEQGQVHAYEDPEAKLVERFFARRPWKVIGGAELLCWAPANISPFHLAPRALAYYLPTYMRTFLIEPLDPMGFAVLEALLVMLMPPAARGGALGARLPANARPPAQEQAMAKAEADGFNELVAALDPKQKAAVTAFLEAFEPVFEDKSSGNDMRMVLDAFWRQYR